MRRVIGRIRGKRGHETPSRPFCWRAVSVADQMQDAFAFFGVDHAGEKPPCRLGYTLAESRSSTRPMCSGSASLGSFIASAAPAGAYVKKALAAIVGAGLSHDVALIDQLLEHASERLFGDLEDVEQFGNLHTWIAIDEVEDAGVRAPEAERLENLIRIADEIAVGKEQKLDQVPVRFSRFHRRIGRFGV